MTSRSLVFAAAAAALALSAGAALALDDAVLNAAISANQIGEQADGYLGVVDGAAVSADARARLNQVNLRRRETYTARAQQNGVSVDEYARSFACTLLTKNTPVGASYRNESGWQRNSAGVSLPGYCPA